MSSPRLRRLKLDHERLEHRFRDWPIVRVTGRGGTPPEQYQVTYAIKGLYAAPDGRVIERDQHVVEINLSLAYPRRAPQCKMLTPIFHPNFDETSVCIGDFWAASEGLDDLIVRIGRMIAYQEYNTRSPLNGLAARWTEQHAAHLPVDGRDIAPPAELPVGELEQAVVVRFDDGALTTETAPDTGPPAPVRAQSVHSADESRRYFPRLDFGGYSIALGAEAVTIGRADTNTIQISDGSMSLHHAEIIDGLLRDLGSTNGTTVNGAPITQSRLRSGDRISFGGLAAIYHDGASEAGRRER